MYLSAQISWPLISLHYILSTSSTVGYFRVHHSCDLREIHGCSGFGSLTLHSVSTPVQNDDANSLDFINTWPTESDICHNEDELVLDLVARSSAPSREGAQRSIDQAALALQFSMKKTWNEHRAAQQQVLEAKNNR